ncbi:nitrogen regulation protein NR(II) [Sphaerotilus microaerophilus]|jgi:two-component system nitrogen regulation sensor histidine kinase GlnL|uniref:histidine kinase n=2 Tax=Sphaerotilus microaerophilus TaxID=2914710 RepID=A0ABM7YTQ0_9BURK|nr:nitrogen regulation protein NR(II) [Sphaerotilus sp. FB-5]
MSGLRPASAGRGESGRYEAFDHLATMVAVLRAADGCCLFVNAAFEAALGLPRRALLRRGRLFDWFVDASALVTNYQAVVANQYSTVRLEALLRRPTAPHAEPLPVHVIVTQVDHGETILLELVEIEQQARQDRETRTLDQVRVTKELIRNLAHEIKNPLGGIRGAAQLLEMDLADATLTEYTQVIIHEADRLQALVDRLLAPHRRPHMVADVNIHEVLERVRSLVLAEFSRGLTIVRDYDASLPEFRGDREQLIQAVLNITHNAALALAERRQAGDARIVLRTRAARQVTIGRQRYRLALELHIEDNGPGVPPEIRDRIFFPLVSGREGGSGLGLTLAQDFIQQHQGLIECESEPGRTLFKIQIPLP